MNARPPPSWQAAADALRDMENGRCDDAAADGQSRGASRKRYYLLFMSGRVSNTGAPFYSQGVRQEFHR